MILGALVGDVIGSPYEFGNIKTEDFDLFTPRCRYTDDSVMTLAVADALMRSADEGQPISYALVESMCRLGRARLNVGYGSKFMRWLESPEAFPRPYNSWGNGSGMRVSAVAWAFDSLDVVEFVAAETAKVTHNHPEGIRGTQAVAACGFMARTGASKGDIREYVRERFGYALDFTLASIRDDYSFDVSCQGSVPQAIEAFLESDGFEDAVRKAVSIGGDSDTIGAMAASIAQGAYGVPSDIEDAARMCLDEEMLAINDRFCSKYGVR
ncbi:MAG: ADP-ribosylglycohydrolase family protein [Eggerthellaceae bacterium]|nr:ADP-ribosylglycohydrolase family protein [Eggerthellaceae bacterium]